MSVTRINTTKPSYISHQASSCVYKIRNKITNKYYIGSSVNYKGRWSTHICLLRKNKHFK